MNSVPTASDVHAKLDAIERRRRWKLAVQGMAIVLLVIGVMLLPMPQRVAFTKRDLSFFSTVADSGFFLSWGFRCMLAGVLALVGSFAIRGDTAE